MRYAILAAVSTRQQASDEKLSLETQITKSREISQQKDWQETAGPFVIPGESRTRYVSLDDARTHIAALNDMLAAAERKAFDLLVFYSYDRLGDLADMIATQLRHVHHIQLYSLSQPAEPDEPEGFDPYTTDSEPVIRSASHLYQQIRISALRRYYRQHVPRRIERGLHALTVPWGYDNVGSDKPGVLDPEKGALLIRMKEMFLAGESYRAIARMADTSGVKPEKGGRWDYTTVRKMIINPYYAGYVTWGRMQTQTDLRTRQQKQTWQPRSEWKMEKGSHKPLWSHEDYEKIWIEFRRRNSKNGRFRARYAFSGLLTCGICGETIRRIQKRGVAHWRCLPFPDHIRARDEVILEVMESALAEELQSQHIHPKSEEELESQTLKYYKEIKELKARRERIKQAYEIDALYSPEEAKQKTIEIDERIYELEQRIETIYQDAHDEHIQSINNMSILEGIDDIQMWMQSEDQKTIHDILASTFRKIIITPDADAKGRRKASELHVTFER